MAFFKNTFFFLKQTETRYFHGLFSLSLYHSSLCAPAKCKALSSKMLSRISVQRDYVITSCVDFVVVILIFFFFASIM